MRLASLALFAAVTLAACASDPSPTADAVALPPAVREADFVLLGELHDNVGQHRLRLRWLEQLADERRYALALEPFDADRQEALMQARALDEREVREGEASDLASRARRLAQAAGFDFEGWRWELYRPAIELALRRGLPLVAANLSPADTARVARAEAPPAPPPPGWGEPEAEAMRASIRDGHCGLLPERSVDAMALAQRTRDARMAQALADAHDETGLPVVLLAGNGHVRRDIGVPLHLSALRPHATIVAIGFLERGDRLDVGEDDAAAGARDDTAGALGDGRPFDVAVWTEAQPREDPCVALRARLRRD